VKGHRCHVRAGAAPNPGGQMGTFAIDAATATDAQVASALGISDAAA
jgi:hypothetical protein